MRNYLKYLALTIVMITSLSCTEIIDIELDSTFTRLVVYGEITTDLLQHEVELTRTTDYFFNEGPPPVINASVSISFNDSTVLLEEKDGSPGVYRIPFPYQGIPGTRYVLNISGVDIDEDGTDEEYTAESIMPLIEEADSIQLQKFITPFFSGFQVLLYSKDPEGPNWYNFKILRNGELLNQRISDYTVQPDEFVKNNYIFALPVGFLNDDDEDELILPGDTVSLEINSLTKDYYDFVVDAQSEIFGNNPLFSGPPANVSSNISNNGKGIFAAYSIQRVNVIATPPFIPIQ